MQVNKMDILAKPSFYAQVISGFIILYCVYIYFIAKSDSVNNLIMLFLLGISISVHSIWHLLMVCLLPKQ
jgi:hypothetical protein